MLSTRPFSSEYGEFTLHVFRSKVDGRHHLAFQAKDRATVDAFYRAALAHGARDNGAPGERAYHPGYYAAFVLDPDGNNVEALCMGKEGA